MSGLGDPATAARGRVVLPSLPASARQAGQPLQSWWYEHYWQKYWFGVLLSEQALDSGALGS